MLLGRFLMIVPILALAGSLARKKIVPASAGTFPVTGVTFVVLLVGTVLLVGALNFLPALTLGPIVEHFLMLKGNSVLTIRIHLHYDSQTPFPFLTGTFVWPAIGDAFSKLEPAADGQESGHVRDHGRRGAHHRGHFPLARPDRGSSRKSPSGSGSPSCSPTSPKPSPKAAARPRPRRFAQARTRDQRQ